MWYHSFLITQEKLFDCGTTIRNMADNVENSKDQIIFHIEGYVSNDAFPRTVKLVGSDFELVAIMIVFNLADITIYQS